MIDTALLTRVVNDPDILRWVAPGYRYLDCGFHDHPAAYQFGDEEGLVLLRPVDLDVGLYEMHYLFSEAKRGKAALDLIRYAVAEMFTRHAATVICGAVPREHMASRIMSRALGARPHGPHTDHFGRACILYVIERKTWAHSSAVS